MCRERGEPSPRAKGRMRKTLTGALSAVLAGAIALVQADSLPDWMQWLGGAVALVAAVLVVALWWGQAKAWLERD